MPVVKTNWEEGLGLWPNKEVGNIRSCWLMKKRLISRVIHGPNGPCYTKVPVIDLALAHAQSSKPGEIPTIVDVNNALRAGSGGSWFGETWEACWLTADEYAEFARCARRCQLELQREKRRLEDRR